MKLHATIWHEFFLNKRKKQQPHFIVFSQLHEKAPWQRNICTKDVMLLSCKYLRFTQISALFSFGFTSNNNKKK